MLNDKTQLVIEWLNTNVPDMQFYSSSDAKAFVARELGAPLTSMNLRNTTEEVRNKLILVALREVDWDYIFSLGKKSSS